jgi:hypothetical protein
MFHLTWSLKYLIVRRSLQAIVPYSYLHRRAGAHGWQTRDTPFIIGKSELFCPDMSISVRGERLSHLPKGYFFKKVIEALADPWCAFRESREATSDTFIEQRRPSHTVIADQFTDVLLFIEIASLSTHFC